MVPTVKLEKTELKACTSFGWEELVNFEYTEQRERLTF